MQEILPLVLFFHPSQSEGTPASCFLSRAERGNPTLFEDDGK